MPTYPHDRALHFIWLSPDRDVSLPPINRYRLLKVHSINPQTISYLYYDVRLLSQEAEADLLAFCALHKGIRPIELSKKIFPLRNKDPRDKANIELYEDNIQNLKKGGNLGSAKDLLWPLIRKPGVWVDFDVDIDTRDLPPEIHLEKPWMVLSVYMKMTYEESEEKRIITSQGAINNDIIALMNVPAALKDIRKIQEKMIERCSKQPQIGPTVFADHIERSGAFLFLDHLAKGLSARELRQKVIQITTDKASFRNAFRNLPGLESTLEEVLKKEGLQKIRCTFLSGIVSFTTGPMVLNDVCFAKPEALVKYCKRFHSDLAILQKAYCSSNTGVISLDAPRSDLSWLEEGRAIMIRHENTLKEKAAQIPSALREIIYELQNTLIIWDIMTPRKHHNGLFLPVSNDPNITALKQIFHRFFNDPVFDVQQFIAIPLVDHCAGLDHPATKTIVEKLFKQCTEAFCLELLDNTGKMLLPVHPSPLECSIC